MTAVPPALPLPQIPAEKLGTAEAMAMVMASQVGYREGPDNLTYAGEWYPSQNAYWCAMEISWAAERAGVPTSVIPKHKWTPDGLAWFKTLHQDHLEPEPGDIGYVFFPLLGRVAHVFFVEKVFRDDDGRVSSFQTIEGNSSVSGSSEGTGVWRLHRSPSSRLTFGRPAYRASGTASKIQSEEDHDMRYISVTGEPADPNTYGYTDQEWWVANDEEVSAFGLPPRVVNARQRDVIRSRVLSVAGARKSGLELIKVVGIGEDTGRTFAVLGESVWSPGEEELGSLQAAFGTRRVREVNQRQWDLVRSRLDQLASVLV
jgi:hypothetical protein